MHTVGRFLQHVGLIVPPIAILLQLVPGDARGGTAITLGQMLILLVAAICAFFIGRILEGYGAK